MKYPRMIFDRCKFIASFVDGKDVLDIGCVEHSLERRKHGHWLHDWVRKTARSVLGLDYEAAEVETMKKEGYNVVQADATNFSLNQKFDVVVAGELIEHLLNPAGFLSSVKKHLRPGGVLLMTTPNANCMLYFFENLFLGREHDSDDHTCIYSPNTMRVLLGKCGYRIQHLTFIAENTTYFHTSIIIKGMVLVKQLAQIMLGFFRPNMCSHILVVAEPLNYVD